MAREHVGEESNRMRERPHEDVGDQLINKMYMGLGPGGNIMLVKNLRGPC